MSSYGEDSDEAKPAPRLLAGQGRELLPMAISLPGAARREHDREDQVARTHAPEAAVPRSPLAPAVSASLLDCYPAGA